MSTPEQKAKIIVDKIIDDLSDRKGLGNEWDELDDNLKDEIIEKWRSIVFEVIAEV